MLEHIFTTGVDQFYTRAMAIALHDIIGDNFAENAVAAANQRSLL